MQRTAGTYGLLFAVCLLLLIALHATVLDLPYFWDELGQFIPAALDILQRGAWVPKSTLPNVHPPGVMAYLAGVWLLFGYSVAITRIAMLVMAAAGAVAVYALAVLLCRHSPRRAALLAVAFLLVSPLFWAQSIMAQLDMPAMVFTALALVLFLRDRFLLSALACTVLVLMKETSLVVPAVFGATLLWERRIRPALWFVAPLIALLIWLGVSYRATGHIFGNQEFTHYNIWFQLHPVRLPLTVVRRVFYLFIDNFHWIGTIAIVMAWRSTDMFRGRAWIVTGIIAALQTVFVSILGGAALERYLMPVMPLFYIAAAGGFFAAGKHMRQVGPAAMLLGLTLSIFIHSPFPYPFENNSAVVTFVRLQQRAAAFVAERYPNGTVASAWPFPDALRRPEFGYVDRKIRVLGLANFDAATVQKAAGKATVLVVYSRTWEPHWGALGSDWIRRLLTRYYFYQPQITPKQIETSLGLQQVAEWRQDGQWVEVYAKAP